MPDATWIEMFSSVGSMHPPIRQAWDDHLPILRARKASARPSFADIASLSTETSKRSSAKKVVKGNHAMIPGDKSTKKQGGPSTSKAYKRKYEDESDEDTNASGEDELVNLSRVLLEAIRTRSDAKTCLCLPDSQPPKARLPRSLPMPPRQRPTLHHLFGSNPPRTACRIQICQDGRQVHLNRKIPLSMAAPHHSALEVVP